MGQLIGRLVCYFKGHKRGKRLTSNSSLNRLDHHIYRCPRCGAQWTRKRKIGGSK